jgi:hypothetical protein
VIKPDTILSEIYAIRRKIDSKTKNMTHEEINEYFKATGERLSMKYGFQRVSVDEVRADAMR